MATNGDDLVPLWFQLLVAVVVLAIWVVSVSVEMIEKGTYTTPLAVHGVATIVVTSIFGRAAGRAVAERLRNGNGK